MTIDAHGGVQGFMTLNYKSQEDKGDKHIRTIASQLRAEDSNSIVLVEYSQDKDLGNESYARKEYTKYKIDADKLVSLIKEHGIVEE